MKTGIKELDSILGENLNGELIVIGGRPSMGKTSIALQIMANQKVNEENFGSYIFAGETKEALSRKFFSICAQVELTTLDCDNLERLNNGISGLEFQRVIAAVREQLCEGVSHHNFVSSSRVNIEEVLENIEVGEFLFVDYLQMMNCTTYDKRHEEIEAVMRILKSYAIEKNIPVFVLSQLSRRVEERVGHRPILTDLAGSSSIEEIADKVIFLLRRDYYDALDRPGLMELMLQKNRSGNVGTAITAFIKETGNVLNYKELF
jgi:replicative DNA helicase